MVGRRETGRDGSERDIEHLIRNAIGESVTPSQLLESNSVGFLRRLIGLEGVDGPFISHLQANEQPHYVFHSSGGLSFPMDERVSANSAMIIGVMLGSSAGARLGSPAVGIVTDQRFLAVYQSRNGEDAISIEYSDLTDVRFVDRAIEKELVLRAEKRYLTFRMWGTDAYSSELSDAAAYVFNKSELDGEYRAYDFESGDFSSARAALAEQLRRIRQLADEIDVERVVKYAVKAAGIGIRRSTYAAAIAFLFGAGYAIWTDMNDDNQSDPHSEDSESSVDDIDPEKTAEMILRWQRAGGVCENRGMELAGGALGAAIAIDEQTSGRDVSSTLSDIDIEWIAHQLEAGNRREAGLEIASEAVESYSTELANLLEEDLWEELNDVD